MENAGNACDRQGGGAGALSSAVDRQGVRSMLVCALLQAVRDARDIQAKRLKNGETATKVLTGDYRFAKPSAADKSLHEFRRWLDSCRFEFWISILDIDADYAESVFESFLTGGIDSGDTTGSTCQRRSEEAQRAAKGVLWRTIGGIRSNHIRSRGYGERAGGGDVPGSGGAVS